VSHTREVQWRIRWAFLEIVWICGQLWEQWQHLRVCETYKRCDGHRTIHEHFLHLINAIGTSQMEYAGVLQWNELRFRGNRSSWSSAVGTRLDWLDNLNVETARLLVTLYDLFAHPLSCVFSLDCYFRLSLNQAGRQG